MQTYRERGQGIVEYALIVAGISIVMVLLLYGIGTGLIETTANTVDGWL